MIHIKYLNKALLRSSEKGDLASVKAFIKKGANEYMEAINVASEEDVIKYIAPFALVEEAFIGNLENVMNIIVNGYATASEKALELASENGHLEIVKYLVENGAYVLGNNSIAKAKKNKHTLVVQYLADAMLLECVEYELVNVFIDTLINKKATNIQQALVKACTEGKLEIVKYIAGTKKIQWEHECIDGAVENGYINILEYITKYIQVQKSELEMAKINEDLIHFSSDHLETLKDLIENKHANVSARKNQVLINACAGNHLNIVEYLMQYPDVDIEDQHNQALILASKNGHLRIVEFLVKHGANVGDQHNQALVNASENGHMDIVEYLVLHNADIYDQDNESMNVANVMGHVKIVKYLRTLGC